MGKKLPYRGFSLTEVLLAVGTLAIGMLFIAGTFLVGIHFTTISTERTIAAVAADEAFAKIRLYSVNPSSLVIDQQELFENVALRPVVPDEFAYPSTSTNPIEKQYYWSAICRRVAPDPNQLVQVTVFVSRKTGINTRYRNPANPLNQAQAVNRPMPVEAGVSGVGGNVLGIEPGRGIFFNDGFTIVDNQTGQIYRVLERAAAQPDTILLDRLWQGGAAGSVWVVPPPFGGGRYPCIAIYQKEIRF